MKEYKHIQYSSINIIISALLVFLLACPLNSSPNFFIHKKMLDILGKNIIFNYIITFLIIYFVIDFTYKDTRHPFYEVGISLIILCCYIIYSKIHYKLQLTILFLLVAIYFLNDNINYGIKKKNHKLVNIYVTLKNILITIVIFSMFIGFFF